MGILQAAAAYQRKVDPGELSSFITGRRGVGGALFATGSSRSHPRRGTAAILKLYEDTPWLRLALDTLGSRYAAARWTILAPAGGSRSRALRTKGRLLQSAPWERQALAKVMEETGDVVEVEDHPFLRMQRAGTMASPWLTMPGYEVERMGYQLRRLVGEDLRILLRDRATGIPAMWVPIPAHWVQSPEASRPTFRIKIGSHTVDVDPEDVWWDRRPGLADPYGRGRGVGHALDHELTIDDVAASHLADHLRNRARPDLLIMAPGLGAPAKEAMEESWLSKLQGPGKRGLPYFMGIPPGLNKDDVVVRDLNAKLSDLGLGELRKDEAETVLMVCGVPPDVIGRTESSNRATAYQAEKNLRNNVVIPDLESRQRIAQQRFFEPGPDGRPAEYLGEDRLILHYQLPPLIDQEARAELVSKVPHAFPHNAILSAAGYDPVEGGDDRYFVPAGVTVRSFEDPEAVEARRRAVHEADVEALLAGEPVASIVGRRRLPPAGEAALREAAGRLGFTDG